ncbi:MAG: hypothetical protein U0324_10945 [Polyangiales bacterium]
MARPLAFALEPSDVFLALLRLRAAAEAGRWPVGVSARFAAAAGREFAGLEPCVRAIGVCYSELEARRVAVVDRAPQSRFADVDGALHLAACSIDVALELDHVRVAVDRGDRAVRDNGRLLASALRQLLWYAVHSDLLVCSRMMLGGAETSPDRVLEYVDSYLASAWPPGAAPEPPAPGAVDADDEHEPIAAHPPEHTALPFHESTAVFHPDRQSGAPGFVDLLGDTGTADAFDRASVEPTSPSGLLDPDVRAKLAAGRGDGPEHFALGDDAESGAWRRSILDGVTPSRKLSAALDALSDDALFFLETSGTRWPCDHASLQAARAVLLARVPRGEAPVDARGVTRAWSDRVERGYDELRRLVER